MSTAATLDAPRLAGRDDAAQFVGGLQDSHESVAQYSVSNVADVRSLVGIDAGVLDHLLRPIGHGQRFAWHRRLFRGEQRQQPGAFEKYIQIAGAGHLDARDFGCVFKF